MTAMLEYSTIHQGLRAGWQVTQHDYRVEDEGGWETLFTLCNGYVGLRGALELPSSGNEAAAFFAGVFDKPDFDEGQTPFGIRNIKSKALAPAMAIAPTWHGLEIDVDGASVDFLNCTLIEFSRTLDMARGLLFNDYALQDRAGRVTELRTLSFISRADAHYALQLVEVTARNYAAPVTVRFLNALDTAPGYIPRLRDYIARTRMTGKGATAELVYLNSQTEDSGVQICLAAKTVSAMPMFVEQRQHTVAECCHYQSVAGETATFLKQVSFATSLDGPSPDVAAQAYLRAALDEGAPARMEQHIAALSAHWSTADVAFTGDDETLQGVRWDIFNLIQLGNPQNPNYSIGATGLHGQGYFGHVFWDTELFMLPFYLASDPAAARALLLYRYHRLDAARHNAHEAGLDGAKFPWTSTWQGYDVTPLDWRGSSGREIHVNGAVAYAFWNYLRWTGDDDFYRQYGIEVIVEIAKFWASFATCDEQGAYHINNVVGPDEYNIHANDNYYTNKLAQWNMREALRAMAALREAEPARYTEMSARLDWSETRASGVRHIADHLAFPRVRDHVCEQYRGFFDLQDVPPMERGAYFMPISQGHAFGSMTQMSKQADVEMMHFLFEDDFSPQQLRASYEYYDARCNHGSSLSPAIYSIMGLKVGLPRYAYGYFQLTALLDIKNLHIDKNLREGIHAACAGGTWMAAVYGFGGVSIHEEMLVIAPRLPEQWSELRFSFRYQGRVLRVQVSSESVSLRLEGDEPLLVRVYETIVLLKRECSYQQSRE